MPYAELFEWWIVTISWSMAFPIAVSVYLYRARRGRTGAPARISSLAKDFTFVWFLLGLLAFYVVAVGGGSSFLFALGNLVFEGLLLLYVLRSSGRSPR